MPRYFRAKGSDQLPVVIDDEGMSHRLQPDGSLVPDHSVHSMTRVAIPNRTLIEMQNLVAGGTWEEFQPDKLENTAQPEPPPESHEPLIIDDRD